MLRMLKHSAWIRRAAVAVAAVMVWQSGPSAATAGLVAAARREAERTRLCVRLLDAPNSSTNSFVNNELPEGTRHRIEKVDSGGTADSLFDGSRVLTDSRADYTHGGITGLISEREGSTTRTPVKS